MPHEPPQPAKISIAPAAHATSKREPSQPDAAGKEPVLRDALIASKSTESAEANARARIARWAKKFDATQLRQGIKRYAFVRDERPKLLLVGEEHDDAADQQFVEELDHIADRTNRLRVFHEGVHDGNVDEQRQHGWIGKNALPAESKADFEFCDALVDSRIDMENLRLAASHDNEWATKILSDDKQIREWAGTAFERLAKSSRPLTAEEQHMSTRWIDEAVAFASFPEGEVTPTAFDIDGHYTLERRNAAMTNEIARRIGQHPVPHVYSVGAAHLRRTEYTNAKSLSDRLGRPVDSRSLGEMLGSRLSEHAVYDLGQRKDTQRAYGVPREWLVRQALRQKI